MRSRLSLVVTVPVLLCTALQAAGPRAILIEARNLAYDANYRNDQAGLRSAIASVQPLVHDAEVGAYANYYLSWMHWALSASQVQEKDMAGALDSARQAAAYARAAVATHGHDPEFLTALADALIVVAILDKDHFKETVTELAPIRRNAIELGPANPRAVLMDAGMIFNTPAEMGGGHERGIARWQEALTLFEAEANTKAVDPLEPRWGYALAYGWMTTIYLRMSPPQADNARAAADVALRMRPDFWYVREYVLPRLRH